MQTYSQFFFKKDINFYISLRFLPIQSTALGTRNTLEKYNKESQNI